jgi:hypothetical protein
LVPQARFARFAGTGAPAGGPTRYGSSQPRAQRRGEREPVGSNVFAGAAVLRVNKYAWALGSCEGQRRNNKAR